MRRANPLLGSDICNRTTNFLPKEASPEQCAWSLSASCVPVQGTLRYSMSENHEAQQRQGRRYVPRKLRTSLCSLHGIIP